MGQCWLRSRGWQRRGGCYTQGGGGVNAAGLLLLLHADAPPPDKCSRSCGAGWRWGGGGVCGGGGACVARQVGERVVECCARARVLLHKRDVNKRQRAPHRRPPAPPRWPRRRKRRACRRMSSAQRDPLRCLLARPPPLPAPACAFRPPNAPHPHPPLTEGLPPRDARTPRPPLLCASSMASVRRAGGGAGVVGASWGGGGASLVVGGANGWRASA